MRGKGKKKRRGEGGKERKSREGELISHILILGPWQLCVVLGDCLYLGIPSLAVAAVAGFVIGNLCRQAAVRYRANEDLAVWDYVAKHPEDFQELERKITFCFYILLLLYVIIS